jgi:hypothetical protein
MWVRAECSMALCCMPPTCQVYTVRTQTCCELYSLEKADLEQLKGFFPDDYVTVRQKALLRMFRIIVRQIPSIAPRTTGWRGIALHSCERASQPCESQDTSNDGEISKEELGLFARRFVLTTIYSRL